MACEGGWKTAEKRGRGNGKARESEFVLGDDDDEEEEGEESQIEEIGRKETTEEGLDEYPPPDYNSTTKETNETDLSTSPPPPPPPSSSLHHHLLTPGDTLLGLSLRYGLDPHHLCTLNNLPFSTIHTTPHLLHTRRYLLLLPSTPPPLPASVQTQLAHERALARFAMVTKETDPFVRGAYIGLAEAGHFDDHREEEEGGEAGYEEKKTSGKGVGAGGVSETPEGRAVGRFFEDAEWERENGGGGRLRGFPVASSSSAGGSSGWKSAGSSRQSVEASGSGSWWSGWGSKLGGGKEEKREVKPAVKVG